MPGRPKNSKRRSYLSKLERNRKEPKKEEKPKKEKKAKKESKIDEESKEE